MSRNIEEARTVSQNRIRTTLPPTCWDCPACLTEGGMKIRRSAIREDPCADDICLKCQTCYHLQTHGIPLTRQDYEREIELRGGERILEYALEAGESESIQENLEALGYIDR